MSVMAETSKLAMGPYVATAVVRSALYAWTAVCSCDGAGGGGEGGEGGEGDKGGKGGESDGDGGSGDGGGNMHASQLTLQLVRM